MAIIQFTQFEDFINELSPQQIVRIEVLGTVEATASIHNVARIGLGVHLRTLDEEGNILACYLRTGSYQEVNGRPVSENSQQIWDQAENLKARIKDFLAKQGFQPRPGVIELGDIQLLRASFPDNLREDHDAAQ